MNLRIDTPSRQFSALVILALIWGSSFILMKRGLESFSPEKVAQLRLFVSFIFLSPIAIINRKHFPKEKKQIIGLIIVALCGNLLPAFLFTQAQTKLPSGIAGMINSLVPLFTLLIGVLVFKTIPVFRQTLGILIGLCGAFLLIYASQSANYSSIPILYPILIVIATICYAISVNTIKSVLKDIPAVQITAFSFALIFPVVSIGLFDATFFTEATANRTSLISLGYVVLLGFLGTAVALLLFNQLIKYSSAVFASSVTYFIPVVASLWGVLDGELFSWWHLGGMGLILGGVYMVNLKTAKRK